VIVYKYPQLLTQDDHATFDIIYPPGAATTHSGIYRCEGCAGYRTSRAAWSA